jgi:hypothetical protein
MASKPKAKEQVKESIEEVDADGVITEKHAGGRPTGYDPSYVMEVAELCLTGATDEEVADYFGITTRTLYRWKLQYPEFCQALKVGKENADERVERALYQRATGYYYNEKQAHKIKQPDGSEGIVVVEVEKYMPPAEGAQQFWLKNRRRRDWADLKQIEVGGPGDFSQMTDDELQNYILEEGKALGLHNGTGKDKGKQKAH